MTGITTYIGPKQGFYNGPLVAMFVYESTLVIVYDTEGAPLHRGGRQSTCSVIILEFDYRAPFG